MNPEAPRLPYGHYAAIAAVACAVILFEVLVTRILSVTLSYHFAFLTISLAMLGLAAPSVWFSLELPRPSVLFIAAINGATSVLASVLALVIALITGFTVVLGCAVAAYLVAAVTLPESRRSA